MTLERPGLQILIGPTVERSLMDIVLGPAPWCQTRGEPPGHRPGDGHERPDGRARAAEAAGRDAATRAARRPRRSTAASARPSSLLVSSQNDDGGWSWTGRGGASERYATARVVWALSLARKAGYTVPDESLQQGPRPICSNQVAATAESDYESKAILLHALATAGQGDFALANRLYRERPSLSAAALAYLALAFAEMDRKPTAGELLDLLAKRNLDDAASRRKSATGSLPWSHSPAELRALYGLGPPGGRAASRPRPRNWSIGSWPIARAIAGRPTRPPARPRWRCAAGSPRAASRASTTS